MARPSGNRSLAAGAIWTGVALLALVGFAGSIGRGVTVFKTRSAPAGEVRALSRLDTRSTDAVATLLGLEPGTEAYSDIHRQYRRFLGKFYQYPTATLLHVAPAAVFMLLAPFQFSRRLRSRHPGWHRWSGRVIVAMAIPIGLSGFFFGLLMPFGGALEASAIALFGGFFLVALSRAVVAIRRGDVTRHREWMIRMFAVAIGVSMVRVAGTVLLLVTRQGPEAWFGHSVWIGFVTTVALAEWWVRRTRAVTSRRPLAILL
ncbi:MAG TPA: DUF2306 domain-containing protein [Vicinamibacterales bacterium]|nr:DUF2306 domain-containing protein [Vicinamibacterales bacterium]